MILNTKFLSVLYHNDNYIFFKKNVYFLTPNPTKSKLTKSTVNYLDTEMNLLLGSNSEPPTHSIAYLRFNTT